MKILRQLPAVVTVMVIVGCAATVPDPIRETPPGNPSLAEVRASPDRFVGERVRWGGTITAVENEKQATWVEIVARDLDDSGRPEAGDTSYGRFLARLGGFVDPAIYGEGREITVIGTLSEPVQRTIGEYPYRYPVVDVSSHYLWPRRTLAPARYRDPFWYDPWYDPWYPFYHPPYAWPYRPYW